MGDADAEIRVRRDLDRAAMSQTQDGDSISTPARERRTESRKKRRRL
jgi:hypothetical protein